MIDFLSNWIEQIALAVIIASIFELILPNGNIKKYVKIVLGIYVVFCIISPFVKNSNLYSFNEDNIENYIEDMNLGNQTTLNQKSMDNRLQNLYIDELENDIKKRVKENGYEVSNCKIDADLLSSCNNPGIHSIVLTVSKNNQDTHSIEKVEINVSEDIDMEEENLNGEIENLKNTLAEYYKINKEVISIKLK